MFVLTEHNECSLSGFLALSFFVVVLFSRIMQNVEKKQLRVLQIAPEFFLLLYIFLVFIKKKKHVTPNFFLKIETGVPL